MAVPSCLDGNFRYLSTPGVTDVATIITDLRSELVTNGVWTEPVANSFKMNPTAGGLFMTLIVSSVSTTRMQFKVTDRLGTTINDGTIDIDAGGTEIRYYTGATYCYVESVRATGEFAGCFKFDADPEPDDIDLNPFAAWAHRNSSGSVLGTTIWPMWFSFNTAAAYAAIEAICQETYGSGNYINGAGLTISGAYRFGLCEGIHGFSGPGQYLWCGRVPQMLTCASAIAVGTEIVVPLDTGVTGTFKRAQARGNTFSQNVAFRKA